MNFKDMKMLENIKALNELSPKNKKIGVSTITAVLVMCLTSYFLWFDESDSIAQTPSGPPPAAVVVASALTMTMAPHTTLPGTVVSLRDAVIASEISGKILSVALIGDIVIEGDSLAQIDPKNAQQLVAQRQADLQRLESLHTYHSNYYKRVDIQENKLGIPEIGIAQLKSNVETAKADVAKAKATLISAENDLERTTIKAPFSGRVVSQSIQLGEFAQVGSSIVRLVDTENLEVSARVPAAMVQPIKQGTLLSVTGMGKSIQASMRALVPVGDAISRTMELRVELNNSGLLVGSPVRVSLPSAQAKEVVAVPRDAIILRTDVQYVFVVNKEGKAERQEVELGYAEGDMIEVVGNVKTDDVVIIRGGERLRDGQSVVWQEEPAAGSLATSAVSSAP